MNGKPIILIGATSGAGKSTLNRELAAKLQLDHALGVGFIREAIRTETTAERDPDLFRYSFQIGPSGSPVDTLLVQSKRLYQAIDACIKRANREGTSLIIEGTHLIPELYHAHPLVTHYLILTAPEADEHRGRILGPSHQNRVISEEDIANIRFVDAYFRAEATKYHLPQVVYRDNLDEITKLLGF